jgi:hypothetical protein
MFSQFQLTIAISTTILLEKKRLTSTAPDHHGNNACQQHTAGATGIGLD